MNKRGKLQSNNGSECSKCEEERIEKVWFAVENKFNGIMDFSRRLVRDIHRIRVRLFNNDLYSVGAINVTTRHINQVR